MLAGDRRLTDNVAQGIGQLPGVGQGEVYAVPGPAGRPADRAVRFSWKIGLSRRIRVIIGYQNIQVSQIFHDFFR
jgi:hypothetical protein